MGTPKQENNNVIQVTNSVKKPYGKIVLTLKNCLLPEEKLSPTPSQIDGLDQETEVDLRVLGCELIQTAGILLKLPQVAMATGQVLFQRFYYSKSFVRHAMETTAMGCVCLASKIEEAPRRIRDVINVFHHVKQVKGQKCRSAGELATQGSGGVTASHAHSAPPKARHDTQAALALFLCFVAFHCQVLPD